MPEVQSFRGQKYAFVTAGGTLVALDGMRTIGNNAEGDFGVAIANALAARGVPVVLLLSRLGFLKHKAFAFNSGVIVVSYTTYDQYVSAIHQIVELHGQPTYAFSTAAVSDYGPAEVVKGKISSSEDELSIKLVKLPKVLSTWRDLFGPSCKIVGFKFLSMETSSHADLYTAAWNQNVSARLDLTVANLKEEIGGGKHPVYLVDPEGWVHHLPGDRLSVAHQIVEYVLSNGRAFISEPPESWTDVIRSSTIRLRSRDTDQTLLLLRSGSTVYEQMWSNLGGRQDSEDLEKVREMLPGGSPEEQQLLADWITGLRELYEESAKRIDLRHLPLPADLPKVHYSCAVKKATGERRVYRVVCFPVDIDGEPECDIPEGEGTEIRWIDAAEARTLPKGPATHAVLQETWPSYNI